MIGTLDKVDSINKLNLKLEVKDLVHALAFANSIVEKRNVKIELSHIKLTAKDNRLEITATDIDLTLIQKINVQNFHEGETSLPSGIFTDIIRKFPDKEIALLQIAGNDKIEIIAPNRNCNYNLLTLPIQNFPLIEEMKMLSSFKMSCKDFAKLIDYTQFAISNEETRYTLNGIYLHNKTDGIYTAATDGHRLSIAAILTEQNEDKNFEILLPRKTVQEILKIVKDQHNSLSDIEVFIGMNKIKFICNNIIMISKVIDGTFPEYDSFIPANNSKTLTINTKLLAEAIERVSIVTTDQFRAIKIILTGNFITITASGEARGTAEEKLICSDQKDIKCEYTGEDLTIGFNPRYLIDVLTAIKHEPVVEINFNDPSSPALITLPGNQKDKFVIMPVKV